MPACRPAAVLALALLVAPAAPARIGDTEADLDARLVRSGLGLRYPKARLDERVAEGPFAGVRASLPPDHEVVAFWKGAGSERASAATFREGGKYPPGWDLQVVLLGGRSYAEFYRRNGSELTEFELRGLLAANQGASFWRRVERGKAGPTYFGYDYETDSGELRARHRGATLFFFPRSWDEVLAARAAAEREAARVAREAEAPNSVAGF